jgi:SAM-dependent methyltransferase
MGDLIPPTPVPPGQRGPWKIEKFKVSEQDASFHNLRAMINAHRGETMIQAGEYTRLMGPGGVMMSDTPGEKQDHYQFVQLAAGRVLIVGLGLGMVTYAVLLKRNVTHVTVVEIDPDIIALVAPHVYSMRLEIVQADIHTWEPPKGERFDHAWFDIWPTICEDHLEDMKKLKDRFRRSCKRMGFWSLDHFILSGRTRLRENY